MLKFDNQRFYIRGMRNGKTTCNRKMTPREKLLGLVIPFILFWGGILTPIITDSLLVWVLCLVPFYGFVVVADNVLRGKVDRSTFVGAIFMGLISSVLLAVMLFIVPFENEVYRIVCRMGILNIIPSFLFMLFEGIDNIKGFGFFPMIIGGENS